MHMSFKIHYRNNLIDKKDSYPIPRPPSWDDRNYSYGHQLYPSEYQSIYKIFCIAYHVYSVLLQDGYHAEVYCIINIIIVV
jgi:hypothetical protein